MKKINLSITKCTNDTCQFRIISEKIMKKCPICHGILVKDKHTIAQAVDSNEGFITLKKKIRNVKK